MQTNKSSNVIVDLTFDFALEIIKYAETLDRRKKYIISTQLLKASTSIGANVREAQNAESKTDFIHKLKVAAKEADETEYWLLLCKASLNDPECDKLLTDCVSIMKVLSKIIATIKLKI